MTGTMVTTILFIGLVVGFSKISQRILVVGHEYNQYFEDMKRMQS